jgi:hypothetical protein
MKPEQVEDASLGQITAPLAGDELSGSSPSMGEKCVHACRVLRKENKPEVPDSIMPMMTRIRIDTDSGHHWHGSGLVKPVIVQNAYLISIRRGETEAGGWRSIVPVKDNCEFTWSGGLGGIQTILPMMRWRNKPRWGNESTDDIFIPK